MKGDLIPGEPVHVELTCRAEPAGAEPAGADYLKRGANSARVDYTWVVYCENQSEIPPAGTAVELMNAQGEVFAIDTVKRVSIGQMHVRIWL